MLRQKGEVAQSYWIQVLSASPCWETAIKFVPVISKPGHVTNIFSSLVKRIYSSQPPFNFEVFISEVVDYSRLRDAAAVIPPLFLVFDYIERYLIFFDEVHFRRMKANSNDLQMPDDLGERHYKSVAR